MELSGKTALRVCGALCAALASAMVLAAPVTVPATSHVPMYSDAHSAAVVSAALRADPDYYFRHVSVSVHDGVARLSGYVWSTDALYRAEAIARDTPGVTGVVDKMELERNGTSGSNSEY